MFRKIIGKNQENVDEVERQEREQFEDYCNDTQKKELLYVLSY